MISERISIPGAMLLLAAGFAHAQAPGPVDSGVVIQTETRVVLVDAIVTDKKDNYLRNLTAKDFKVWEDNKEQTIKSFSYESGAANPTNRRLAQVPGQALLSLTPSRMAQHANYR